MLLLSADSLLARLPPVSYVQARSFELKTGAPLAIEPLRLRLAAVRLRQRQPGHQPRRIRAARIAVRRIPDGQRRMPVRVDLLDDRIDSIRRFDPDTQRSLESIEQLRLLPARELPLDAEAVKAFRRRYRARFEGDVTRMPIYRGVSEGIAPPGIEFYLPLFFEATRADHATTCRRSWWSPATATSAAALERAWEGISARYEDRRHDIERPLLPPAEAFIEPRAVRAALAAHPSVGIERFAGPAEPGSARLHDFHSTAPPEFRLDARAAQPLAPLTGFLGSYAGRVLIAADSPGRREVIVEMLGAHGRRPRALQLLGAVRRRRCAARDLRRRGRRRAWRSRSRHCCCSASRSCSARARARSAGAGAARCPIRPRSCAICRASSPARRWCMTTYGVGRYLGLQLMEIGQQSGEFLALEYRDGDRVYVPVHALHLVNRYTGGAPESAPLHKLGTDQWARARRRAAEAVRDVAAELLDLHARRAAHQAAPLNAGELEYQTFANGFPFEETADQAEAIRQVLKDMQGTKPMDRVVCGDVGFGKTEVAMRAAFVAVQAGRQVARAGADHAAGAAAPAEFPRPLRRLAGAHRGAVALSFRR